MEDKKRKKDDKRKREASQKVGMLPMISIIHSSVCSHPQSPFMKNYRTVYIEVSDSITIMKEIT